METVISKCYCLFDHPSRVSGDHNPKPSFPRNDTLGEPGLHAAAEPGIAEPRTAGPGIQVVSTCSNTLIKRSPISCAT